MNSVSYTTSSLSRISTGVSPCNTQVNRLSLSTRRDSLEVPRAAAPQMSGTLRFHHLDEPFVRKAIAEITPVVMRMTGVRIDASGVKIRLLDKEEMEHEQAAVMQRTAALSEEDWKKIDKPFIGQVGGKALLRESPCLMDYKTKTLLLSSPKFSRVSYDTLRSHLFRALLTLGIAQTQTAFIARSDQSTQRYADELLHHGAKSGAAESARKDMVRDQSMLAGFLRMWRYRANKELYPACKKLSPSIFVQMKALSHGGALSNADAIRRAEERAGALSQASAFFKVS